jgi:hypothetical protein
MVALTPAQRVAEHLALPLQAFEDRVARLRWPVYEGHESVVSWSQRLILDKGKLSGKLRLHPQSLELR